MTLEFSIWFQLRSKLLKQLPIVEMETILIEEGNTLKRVKIRKGLETVFKEELTQLLREYADVIAWNPNDIAGIEESLAIHSLYVDPRKKLVKQKRRNFSPKTQISIDGEVENC